MYTLQFLLTLLVNRLGHPNKKVRKWEFDQYRVFHRQKKIMKALFLQVAATSESLLADLARKHMNMRAVIVAEVERLIYR